MKEEMNNNEVIAERSFVSRALRRIMKLFSSIKFAMLLLSLIALVCVIGTLLPQNGDVESYILHHPDDAGLIRFLDIVGFTHVFSVWWFMALLFILSLSLLVCTLRKASIVPRLKGSAKGRAIASVVTHISLLLIFAGAVVRGVWGVRGYLGMKEGESWQQFAVENGVADLPFIIHLSKFETQMYQTIDEELLVEWSGSTNVTILPVKEGVDMPTVSGVDGNTNDVWHFEVTRKVKDFLVNMETHEVSSRSDAWNNPAVLVKSTHSGIIHNQWVFSMHPEFNGHVQSVDATETIPFTLQYKATINSRMGSGIKDWKSTLEIVENDKIVKTKTIEVNDPLSYKGYTFYQSGFSQDDPTYTSLQVVKDPGVPLVYLGFIMMIVGLGIMFYMFPSGNNVASFSSEEK